jgi:hypothetical protein
MFLFHAVKAVAEVAILPVRVVGKVIEGGKVCG